MLVPRKEENATSKPMGLTTNAPQSDVVREEFKPFVSSGFVSLEGESTQIPIKILRDTELLSPCC